MWTNATNSKMSNVGIAFDTLHAGQNSPPGWRKASGHIIFHVKMDFTRKSQGTMGEGWSLDATILETQIWNMGKIIGGALYSLQ